MFEDRAEAGERLAARLASLRLVDPLVLALPRGGVPVAVPVAARLGAPLGIVLVRKIGVPGYPELAAGAIMAGPAGEEIVWNDDVLTGYGIRPGDLAGTVEVGREELAERRRRYPGAVLTEPLAERSVIVVDDGIATGMTVEAALRGIARQAPHRVVLAVPVAPEDALERLRPLVDTLVCLKIPQDFLAVGAHYRDFRQVEDDVVATALRAARKDGPDAKSV